MKKAMRSQLKHGAYWFWTYDGKLESEGDFQKDMDSVTGTLSIAVFGSVRIWSFLNL
jgi:hypothetical protein